MIDAMVLPVDSFSVVALIATFALISVGLHVTFGLLNIVNLAHGEFILIGAYATFELQDVLGGPVPAMIAAPFIAAAVGVLAERTILRFLYDRPLDTLLATFGMALVIRQAVQLKYSANPRQVADPIGGSFQVGSFNVPWWRFVLVLVTIAVIAALVALLRTRIGVRWRATVANPDRAETLGVHTGRARTAMFGVGCGLAGLAGAVLAPLNTLNPQFGTRFLINSFLVVILGGQGSLGGLVAAAVVLGGTLGVLQFHISTVYAQIAVLLVAVLATRVRPLVSGGLEDRRTRRRPRARVGAGQS
ncbi:MAG: branched-chain amino acid ABC transporter permease [Acidimicrobiales bacterium]